MAIPSAINTTLISHLFIIATLCFFSNPGGSTAASPSPEKPTVPALLVFGDSILDSGNNDYVDTLCRVNYLPYGRDFDGGDKPTGRFSNGKIPSDLLAEKLGIKEFVPPYLDPTLQIEDLLTGVDFASGCSGYDPHTCKIEFGALTMDDQFKMFKEYVGKLKAAVGEERTASIISQSFYLIGTGNNDLLNNYFNIFSRTRLRYTLSSYVDLLLSYASKFLQELHGEGGRRMVVLSVSPLGCLPAVRTGYGGLFRTCDEEFNKGAIVFNSKLKATIQSLSEKLTGARIFYVDIYGPLLDLIHNYQKFGFVTGSRGCCGTGTIEVGILCNVFDPCTCKNATSFLFWDAVHPTERGYQLLLNQLFSKIVDDISQD
ncbi:hypothetical protein Nepgr_026394 [Nepenthes gracilis]|uniref:GDSL esterase/lipase EXL3 n=1 Tax=Nepenthes gracilis TaxID=150966 RepID=A0AAD3T8I5_NEPGR|nr:hypothetical protein Nepgr_026394 [Nepenthes gracilis]